jgi:predicted Zn finger-like uncharacterized protein
MIIECPNCHSRFKINPAVLSAQGREVVCSKCRHVWHQIPLHQTDVTPKSTEDENQAIADDLKRAQEIVSSLQGEADVKVLSEAPAPKPDIKQNASDDDFNRAFADILKEEDAKTITPPAAPPSAETSVAPVIDAMSLSKINEMKRMPYLIFLMLTLITFMLLIFGREKIVNIWQPAAGLFYALGIPTDVFGKDFVFSDFNARIENFNERPIVLLSGVLENNSRAPLPYPAFKITFYNQAKTKTLSTRELRADDVAFEPMEKRPFKLGIENFPKEVSIITIKVMDPQKIKKEHAAP